MLVALCLTLKPLNFAFCLSEVKATGFRFLQFFLPMVTQKQTYICTHHLPFPFDLTEGGVLPCPSNYTPTHHIFWLPLPITRLFPNHLWLRLGLSQLTEQNKPFSTPVSCSHHYVLFPSQPELWRQKCIHFLSRFCLVPLATSSLLMDEFKNLPRPYPA